MVPDYEKAATKALEILVNRQTSATPIDALSILLKYPGVRVMTFSRMATETGKERDELVPLFGECQDAATFHLDTPIEGVDYVVVYNRFLSVELVFRAVARELGHIVLGHDGQTRTTDVRMAEALCFAHHLLSPRPVIRLLQEAGVPVTLNVLADITGCTGECVEGLQNLPGVNVPAELNAQAKALFAPGINEYVRFHKALPKADNSPIIDFGTFMDNYRD